MAAEAAGGTGATTAGRVAVVVMGDFGRSPRMQYHALSLATAAGKTVHVVAHAGAAPLPELRALAERGRVRLHLAPPAPRWALGLPRLPFLAIKVAYQALMLLATLLALPAGLEAILLQNPPCIPALAICKLVAAARRLRLVVDWHNYGYSILALKAAPTGALVRLAERYERFWGPRADGAICVTRAMAEDLAAHWGVAATVMHDCPHAAFRRTPPALAHDLFARLHAALAEPLHAADFAAGVPVAAGGAQTLFTERAPPGAGAARARAGESGGKGAAIRLRGDRPALVVSSTSWTPDEDFGTLLEAAEAYDRRARADPALPKVVVAVTGKGPQREMYRARMAAAALTHVAFRTLWLEIEDYPKLLGAADLGVSLHTSSSGLDLPMKVVDMFGCGLPVCAARFACIGELVRDGDNGLTFASAAELATQLELLLRGFPTPGPDLARLRAGALASSRRRWADEWGERVLPMFAAG